jgi:hypothetical protein
MPADSSGGVLRREEQADGRSADDRKRSPARPELCSVDCAFSAQNSSKISATNIDLADPEGVGTKVQFPNRCTGAARPFAVGSLLKVFALNFRGERVFSRSLFCRLRITWVGRNI